MPSIDQLFEEKAAAFSVGDMGTFARDFVTPTSVYLDHRLIYIASRKAMNDFLTQYRYNLQRCGYAGTRFDVLSETIIGSRSVRVALDWVDHDAGGEVINRQVTHFYCVRTEDGAWTITLVSMKEGPSEALLEGILVH